LTESFALPPLPLHDRIKLLLAVNALMVWEPDVDLLPDQSPEAVQSVVLLLVQLNVVEPLKGRFVGLAERLTTGADGAATMTLTESFAFPPLPLHDRTKLLLAVNVLMVWEPEVDLLPDQSPEAVQLVVLLLVQLNVVEPLKGRLVGLAERLTRGAEGGETVTLTESLALPPGPLHDKLKVLLAVNALMV